MSDWRYVLAQNRGTLLAIVFFVVMFVIYTSNHPAGFSANVVQTAANKGVLLALVAMAQTFVVITAGIDLSVGAVFVLTNCLASWILVGTAATATLGVLGVLLTGLACGAINGLIVIYGRLQPIVATIASGAVFFGLALLLRPVPGGDVYGPLADALTGRIFGVVAREPGGARRGRSCCLDPLQPVGDRSGGLRRRLLRERGLYVGRPGRRGKILRLCAVGADGRAGRPVSYVRHLFGRGLGRQRQHLHAVLYRRSRARRRLAVRRIGQRDRRDLRRADVSHHRRSSVRLQFRPAVAAAVPGSACCSPRSASARRGCSRSATGWSFSRERERRDGLCGRAQAPDRSAGRDRFRLHHCDAVPGLALFAQLSVAGISARSN